MTLGSAPEWLSSDQLAAGVIICLADVLSQPVPCSNPLTATNYEVLFEGRQDATATLDLAGASTIWFSTGNMLNATDPCPKPAP
jgi:hypothetical protein